MISANQMNANLEPLENPANSTTMSRRRPRGDQDDDATLEGGRSNLDSLDCHNHLEEINNSNKVSIRERLSHFTWAWFEATMATGALAMLLSQQPNTFPGLVIIGKCLFLLTIVLFGVFSCLIAFRFLMRPSALLRSLHHPHESFYFGTYWVSIDFLLYNTHIYGVPGLGGSPRADWLIKALEVCFWLYACCALLVVVFQYHVIFDEEQLPVSNAMPAWILPAYPFLVLGPLAAKLAVSQPVDAAVPMIVAGLLFNGLGWMIAFMMYGLYIARLVAHDLPRPPERPGMFVAVGPAGKPLAYVSFWMVVEETQQITDVILLA